ncbi:MAG: hypothetical protein HQ505_04940 [Nitrosopumilus sp.]|nr:hypothetical protein [Nitrosopumilus sp.]
MSESEIIIEKLLEQRNFHLNTLKNLDFELVMEPSENDIKNIEKLQRITVDQIKKIEQEIAFLTSKNSKKIP